MADYILATLMLAGGALWVAVCLMAASMDPAARSPSETVGCLPIIAGVAAFALGAIHWAWLIWG